MFRRIFFWTHLVVGLLAGLVIASMCITGALMSFEKQLVHWAERDAWQLSTTEGATPLPLGELLGKVREQRQGRTPERLTVPLAKNEAYTVQFGREEKPAYVNPYTGELRVPASTRMRDFMEEIEEWHRWFSLEGAARASGKLVTGITGILFLGLALSGLILWWPRSLSWRGLKAATVINLRASGKARDWNWHNTLGFWTMPVIIMITLCSITLSFRWGGDLVFALAGESPPAPRQQQERKAGGERERRGGEREGGQRPVRVDYALENAWPRTVSRTETIDAASGKVLKTENFTDQSRGRQLRIWARFLHTGEALGWPGQLATLLATLMGLVLVYTGFALSWRRFFKRKSA